MAHASGVRGRVCVLLAALGLLVAGCGSISDLPGHHRAGDAAQLAVVRGWARALRAGHLHAAAGYFALPSLFANGPTEHVEMHTLVQAELVNSTLPCGAEVISAFREGTFINVLFRLTARAGRGGGPAMCGSGVGTTARTRFLIRHGRIVEWLRAASRPGDPGQPAAPTSTGSGGQAI